MAKGISLHIGLNVVDPKHYNCWAGYLANCESDARALQALAAAQGFTTNMLLTKQATREAVLQGIQAVAEALTTGDFFLLTYAGHGGWVPDEQGHYDREEDRMDETWCLYDGQLLDDELHEAWAAFAPGVRILVLSDSCHSGTVTKDPEPEIVAAQERARFIPVEEAVRTFSNNSTFYTDIQKNLPTRPSPIGASVRLISGCQDAQYSDEHPTMPHGLFTGTLLQIWNGGGFEGTYEAFHQAILAKMPEKQQPNHFLTGAEDPAFDAEKPFMI